MPRVFVSIGSNIDREANVRRGVSALRRHYGSLDVSSVYESAAVGFDGAPFYNLVVAFDTAESPETVRATLRAIEQRTGRERERHGRFGSRTLDLDLILYGDLVRHDERIDVPAADIERYAFVLGPLAELAPDGRHPERDRTFAEMWQTAATRTIRKVPLTLDAES